MQDLTELTDQLDLEVALARTQARHAELLHERAVRRRFVTTGAFAAAVVAAVVLLPQLGSDDRGQVVRFAGPGGSSTAGAAAGQDAGGAAGAGSVPQLPPNSVVPPDFALDTDGDVIILTRRAETVAEVPVTEAADGSAVGAGVALERVVEISGVEATDRPDVVRVHLVCSGLGDQVREVRYVFDGSQLLVNATVGSGPTGVACGAGGAGASIDLPLDREWAVGSTAVAADI